MVVPLIVLAISLIVGVLLYLLVNTTAGFIVGGGGVVIAIILAFRASSKSDSYEDYSDR